ncbi:MAG: hypothetical protein DMG22_11245 [Acidobacteria bacterium]|nr:MAG: hypothetical protein DMG22_11245 [Acidobacteriota bacterium]
MVLARAFILATISLTISLPLRTDSFRALFAQGAEANEFPLPGWRPNQSPLHLTDYVGRKVCAQCHPSEATTQPATPMAHAAEAVGDCAILRKHPHFNFRLGPFRYEIDCRGNRCIYSVSDGKRTLSTPILWAFGQGKAGQTYVLKWEESYYQSYVSFFNDTKTLDITLGFPKTTPPTLEAALGLPLSAEEAPNCFGCHTTAGVNRGRVVTDHLIPGVSCEACHGPGARHSAAMKSGHLRKTYIFSPAELKPDELADFCGACHRTSVQVQVMDIRGVANVRFQPYRLEKARCWNPDDSRISCLACHNPHEQLNEDPAFYDSKCLACRRIKGSVSSSTDHFGPACPVGFRNCVNCHMPKYALPGGHFKFTDHWIRVVKSDESYPF